MTTKRKVDPTLVEEDLSQARNGIAAVDMYLREVLYELTRETGDYVRAYGAIGAAVSQLDLARAHLLRVLQCT